MLGDLGYVCSLAQHITIRYFVLFASYIILYKLTNHRAEIIKIEHPTRGDDTRAWGPPFAKYSEGDDARHVGPPFAKQVVGQSRTGPGESAYFMAVRF